MLPPLLAPDLFSEMDSFEINRMNQLAVHPTPQTTRVENIFVIAPRAACPLVEGSNRLSYHRALKQRMFMQSSFACIKPR